ncbi:MAG: nickel/cobalt efflux transporter RcnA [Defluviicoccus sp.]|nr:MAG: nickel/cobalt efflux transporter RcnA [Defluviicoccus sp.]
MNLSELVSQGQANPVLLATMAIALGALHGLEPGHSKTMIAAYVIAIRGTVSQAVLLGLSAALSHVVIVWVLALLGLLYGEALIGERMEPWFIIASGAIIVMLSVWIFRQSWKAGKRTVFAQHRHHHAGTAHPHHDAGHHDHYHDHDHDHCHADPAAAQTHAVSRQHGSVDAHALAHARGIEARVGSGRTSTYQTVLFGLTGGLIPCPAAITVLLLCLSLGQIGLGLTLVAGFSIGLALTLVVAGTLAAFGMRYAAARSSRFEVLWSWAPCVSSALIGVVGLLMVYTGWSQLVHHPVYQG